ncbi:PolC-type DNA polymerase III [Lacticaseibacillus jixianensis]|uniref:PolC-type DNA polymerase III n=1 Tax=Lacticaseibacillus jixianensis TaxID=2486012 RepID=A0ABW4B9K4_9LACO|nr:3'-5' exonuclease [Lacticaseibacillus jixianensis]
MDVEEVKGLVQKPLAETAWQEQVTAVVRLLAAFAGGDPRQISGAAGEDDTLTLHLRGLWPRAIAQGVPLALGETVVQPHGPRPGQAADRLLRGILNSYVLALRDLTKLPQALYPRWRDIRQIQNQLLALQALLHQWRLDADAAPVRATLYGPVAAGTLHALQAGGVKVTQAKLAKPWAHGFLGDLPMPPIVVGVRSQGGKAGSGQQQEVLARAKHLASRQFARTRSAALSRGERPVLYGKTAVTDFTAFDLEFSSGNAREGMFITEIGAVKVRANHITDTFNAFVQVPARRHLNVYSQRVTGIHEDTLSRYGLPANIAIRQFIDFIGEDSLLGFSMHGGDLPVLRRQFNLYPQPYRLIDVAQLAKQAGPMPGSPEVSLTTYRHYLGLSLLAHGAVYDAVTTYALYAYLQEQARDPEALVAEFDQVFRATSLKDGDIN